VSPGVSALVATDDAISQVAEASAAAVRWRT
jgi:hypothetical protein